MNSPSDYQGNNMKAPPFGAPERNRARLYEYAKIRTERPNYTLDQPI